MLRQSKMNPRGPVFLATENPFPCKPLVLDFVLPSEFEGQGIDRLFQERQGLPNKNRMIFVSAQPVFLVIYDYTKGPLTKCTRFGFRHNWLIFRYILVEAILNTVFFYQN